MGRVDIAKDRDDFLWAHAAFLSPAKLTKRW
jgi:hypothetical protein